MFKQNTIFLLTLLLMLAPISTLEAQHRPYSGTSSITYEQAYRTAATTELKRMGLQLKTYQVMDGGKYRDVTIASDYPGPYKGGVDQFRHDWPAIKKALQDQTEVSHVQRWHAGGGSTQKESAVRGDVSIISPEDFERVERTLEQEAIQSAGPAPQVPINWDKFNLDFGLKSDTAAILFLIVASCLGLFLLGLLINFLDTHTSNGAQDRVGQNGTIRIRQVTQSQQSTPRPLQPLESIPKTESFSPFNKGNENAAKNLQWLPGRVIQWNSDPGCGIVELDDGSKYGKRINVAIPGFGIKTLHECDRVEISGIILDQMGNRLATRARTIFAKSKHSPNNIPTPSQWPSHQHDDYDNSWGDHYEEDHDDPDKEADDEADDEDDEVADYETSYQAGYEDGENGNEYDDEGLDEEGYAEGYQQGEDDNWCDGCTEQTSSSIVIDNTRADSKTGYSLWDLLSDVTASPASSRGSDSTPKSSPSSQTTHYSERDRGGGWSERKMWGGGTEYRQDIGGGVTRSKDSDGNTGYERDLGGSWTERKDSDGSKIYGQDKGGGYTRWSDGTWTRKRS